MIDGCRRRSSSNIPRQITGFVIVIFMNITWFTERRVRPQGPWGLREGGSNNMEGWNRPRHEKLAPPPSRKTGSAPVTKDRLRPRHKKQAPPRQKKQAPPPSRKTGSASVTKNKLRPRHERQAPPPSQKQAPTPSRKTSSAPSRKTGSACFLTRFNKCFCRKSTQCLDLVYPSPWFLPLFFIYLSPSDSISFSLTCSHVWFPPPLSHFLDCDSYLWIFRR